MRNKNLQAGALAFLCAASLSFSTVAPAIAQGPSNQAPAAAASSVNPANIDFNKTGSITVNKYEYQGQPLTATGTTKEGNKIPEGAKPLSGAGFTIVKVKDIKSQADFDAAVTASKTALPATPAEISGGQVVLDNQLTVDGKVSKDGLSTGLYAVYETKAPEGYQTIKPYYVFLPTTYTTADDAKKGLTEWNYDIQSFPKDAKDVSVSKGIKDANKNVGDTVDYFVKSEIPALGDSGLVTWFEFNDYLETENAEITAENQKNISVQIVDDKGTVFQTLDPSAYQLNVKTTTAGALGLKQGVNDYNGAENIQHTNVTLTTDGLYYLTYWKQRYPDLKVQLNLPATAKKVAETDGHEVNDAAVRYSNTLAKPGEKPYTPPATPNTPPSTPPANPPATPPTPPTTPNTPPTTPPPLTEKPTNDVHTYWGKIKLTKEDASDAAKKLKGAEFQVYRCSAGLDDVKNPANLISIKDQKTWTTDANGVVEIDGLHVTDYANSGEDLAATKQTTQYCLVETKAPEGYELLTQPVSFTLSKSDKLENAKTIGVAKTIKDEKSNVFSLPNTGGAGVAMLIAFGGLVTGLGVFAARRNTKKA